jgi:8-oxo-dGTP pyrophosphatase MutT (NUDIX family)
LTPAGATATTAVVRPWRVESSEVLVDRPWLKVHQQRVTVASGATIDEFHLLESPSWAAALAVTAERRVVVVEQYRHGARSISLELPAGVIDAGEAPAAAAERELREETGYQAASWEPLLTTRPEPARGTSTAHFFLGRGARRAAEQRLDASEDIAVREVSAEELVSAALSGRVIHAVHVAAILTAHARGLLAGG